MNIEYSKKYSVYFFIGMTFWLSNQYSIYTVLFLLFSNFFEYDVFIKMTSGH